MVTYKFQGFDEAQNGLCFSLVTTDKAQLAQLQKDFTSPSRWYLVYDLTGRV